MVVSISKIIKHGIQNLIECLCLCKIDLLFQDLNDLADILGCDQIQSDVEGLAADLHVRTC